MYAGSWKILIGLVTAAILAGCAQLPYSTTTETTAGGAAIGAAVGAVLAEEDDTLLGVLLGGLAGAAAGHVIGARTDWFAEGNEQELSNVANDTLNDSITAADVYGSSDADLNNDGLVTQEELIAMADVLGQSAVIDRLQATNQIFHVTPAQRQSLIQAGVDPDVVYRLEDINRGL